MEWHQHQHQQQRVEDAGFANVVFSWSVDDVVNEELYINQVVAIPTEFKSPKEYFDAYKYPLLEETRTELSSSLEKLTSAPYAEVIDIKEAKPHDSRRYEIRVDYWRNRFGGGKEPYKILPGDVLILANKKPETASDLRLSGTSWTYALVDNIMDGEDEEDDNVSVYFKVRVGKGIEYHEESWKSMFLVFLMNITTQRRMWNALHLFRNLQVINRVLSTDALVTMNCDSCTYNDDEVLTPEYDRFLSSQMNESQSEAVLACLHKTKCCHQPSVELIWGPPGTGKTKTVATLLATLLGMKKRILSCAPTNVAITELASRTVNIIRETVEINSENEVLIYPLGDVLLFGNRDRLKVGCDIEAIYLEYRVKKLAECFGPMTGWRYCLTTMIDFLENCVSKYDVYVENLEIMKRESQDGDAEQIEECKSFSDFANDLFRASAAQLRKCIYLMCTHIPKRYIGEDNFDQMVTLFGLLSSFETLLRQNPGEERLKELFTHSHPVDSPLSDSGLINFFLKRIECISALKELQSSLKELKFPSAISSNALSDFCFRTASLIFSTVCTSYKLYSVKMEPLDILVIDEAAQLKECESAIPLQLPGIRHVVLIGDECQLPATVFSTISAEAGFGKSLFARLSTMGYPKHLLNTQYRMHPSISSFPNSNFYSGSIIDASVVHSKGYKRQYLSGAMFGPYSFINIFGAREELDDYHSLRNWVEVAAVVKIIRSLHTAWSSSKANLSVGVISPYTAQVVAIQERLGRKYDNIDGFEIKVKSVDGFQGGEMDIVIISTVRSNFSGAVGFLSSHQRTNVALTRARHCLWILGNERTLLNSGTVWADVVIDANSRNCLFNADDDEDLAKTILEVKKELNQLNDLLNADSVLFRNARWKVLFSDDFKKSFSNLTSNRIKKSVINLLLKVAGGWRPKKLNINTVCEMSSQNLKIFKVESLFVICTVDVIKESQYLQVLRIWNLLRPEEIPKLVKRLDSIFSRYTEDYINHCKEKSLEKDLEVPTTWSISMDLVQFKAPNEIGKELGGSTSDDRDYVENSKVSESLLNMKFYPLSSDVVSVLLSEDKRELDLPFEVTNEEREIILFDKSTFILGRSGTGKTTVLTMKLFEKEHKHHLVTQEIYGKRTPLANPGEDLIEGSPPPVLRQLFVTVSPKLCFAVKQHVSHLKSFASGGKFLAERQTIDVDYADDTTLFKGIKDNFSDVPSASYPLVITFQKLLQMLDGTIGNSYFERFPAFRNSTTGNLRSNALQSFLRTSQVTYDLFYSAYWPHFNDRLKKKLDSSRVYTEIMSHIKGGLQARNGNLSLEEYLKLSENRVSAVGKKQREMIYEIFLDYEKMKAENGHFDLADWVSDLHRRFVCERYRGDQMDFVYIDEVQDLTMRQISLFKYICKNVDEGFVFSGDTAQTIARGVDFRFQDIRSLFYNEFFPSSPTDGVKKKGRMSEIFHLSQNFRTHAGVLKLAQSVIDLIFRFFPMSIDVLSPETSLIYGEAPIILESSQNENAIITIFGQSCNASRQMTGFGADQVILVRDENVRHEIADYVGKQALVLTIVECKGLEFQDVLLYNFFASSPLKNLWRVVYEYMEEQNMLDVGSHVALQRFDEAKHTLMCSELKQLYVAITRTRQRLWICESLEEFSKPMFDYWKRKHFVKVRVLDESEAQAMQAASTPEEWKSRGIKLLAEKNYEMATMCFERAGDEYLENFSKAAGLRATADLMRVSNPEMARSVLKEAAEMFGVIGKVDIAAECYFDLEEFEKAGKLYLDCGESKLELAGDCFHRAGCYDRAAEVYAKGKFLAQCLNVCINAKLFDMGLRFVQEWKQQVDVDGDGVKRSMEIERLEQKFLEDCANHYHHLKDNEAMMRFVRAFKSVELMRKFLRDKHCLEGLASLEEQLGNFLEAAECYLNLEEFEKAGLSSHLDISYQIESLIFYAFIFDMERMLVGKLYLECGESKLELAGDCFHRAGCYDHAAEVYAKGKFLDQCLNVCINAKLFDMGLRYIQDWKHNADVDGEDIKRNMEIELLEQKFLEACANHYHGLKDSEAMMRFVKAFKSIELMRTFLRGKNCLDELASLEERMGNFLEAADIVKQRGNLLLEADLLGKAGMYKKASEQILWCVLARSFSASESTGWPLKEFREKDELLMKAEAYAKNDSRSFWKAFVADVGVLSDKQCSLLEMNQFLRASKRHERLRGEILSARNILDAVLHLDVSKYLWEDKLVADPSKNAEGKILKNHTSAETLVYYWNFFRDRVLNILQCLENLESEKQNNGYEDYEEFCLNVMGAWRRVTDKNTDYILISSDLYWLKEVDRRCVKKLGDLVSIDLQSLVSAAKRFWSIELLSSGYKVLETLEKLYKHSVKNSASLFCSSMLIIHIFEAAQFIVECRFLKPRGNDLKKLEDYLQLAAKDLSTFIFPLDWRRSVVENMVALRGTERCQKVLEEIIVMKLPSRALTHGLIGRIVTLLLGSAVFDGTLYGQIIRKFNESPPWQIFVDILWSAPRVGGVEQIVHPGVMSLPHYFERALADTYNVNWVTALDYMSPSCFVYCMECLVVSASCSSGFFYTTKSTYVEWFVSKVKALPRPASPDVCIHALGYVTYLIEQILADKNTTMWIRRSWLPETYYPMLVLRLIVLLCVVCLYTQTYYDVLFRWLGRGQIAAVLPQGFAKLLLKLKKSSFLGKVNLIAEAFALIENPLVIVSNGADCSKLSGPHSILVKADDSRDIIFRTLFPANATESADEVNSTAYCDAVADVNAVAEPVEPNAEPSISEQTQVEKQGQNRDSEELSCKHATENNGDADDEAGEGDDNVKDEADKGDDNAKDDEVKEDEPVGKAGNGSQSQKGNQGNKGKKKGRGGGNNTKKNKGKKK